MGDLRSLFQAIYDRFIIRDVFGKVVGASIILFSVSAALTSLSDIIALLSNMTFVHWGLTFGLAWVTSFVLQGLGESMGVLKVSPPPFTREQFHTDFIDFQRLCSDDERAHAERLLVIKEAAGNTCMALFLVVPLVPTLLVMRIVRNSSGPLDLLEHWFPLAPILVLSMVAGLSLRKVHVEHLTRYGAYVARINEIRRAENQQPSDR